MGHGLRRLIAWFIRSEYGLVLAYSAFLIAVGLIIASDFGESWDEHANAQFGEATLGAYVGSNVFREAPQLEYTGGAPYFMAFSISSKLITQINDSWLRTEARHFTNFLTFQIAIIGVYMLSRRLVSKPYALMTVLLFSTQPLFFGHAFINQKDIPFLAVFTMVVALGLSASDDWARIVPSSQKRFEITSSLSHQVKRIRGHWLQAGWTERLMPAMLLAVTALATVELFGEDHVLPWLRELVADLYAGRGWPQLAELFARIAQDAYKTPVEAYQRKVVVIYSGVRLVIVPLLLFASAVSIGRVIMRPIAGSGRPLGVAMLKTAIAAFLLGLAIPMREIAPLAGLLVSLYLIYRLKWASLPALIGFWSVAAITTYLAWPHLWGRPIAAISDRLNLVLDFNEHMTLYQGVHHSSKSLPGTYLPTLFSLQFTEPAIIGVALGVFFMVTTFLSRPFNLIWILLGIWAAIPIMSVVFLGTPIYNNFRHILFAAPPLFILAGFGWAKLMKKVRSRSIQFGIAVLVLLPGIYGIIAGHPYEYVYYNSFVGGVEGAARRYELDYWCTSYREAMEFVNSVADEGTVVAVQHPESAANAFAREDLTIVPDISGASEAEYFIGCNRAVYRENFHPEAELVYQVRRGEALYAVVKKASAEAPD